MINTLTSLRLFFALMVFGAHCYVVDPFFAAHVFKEGFVGVSFFFVLSGFIIAYNYQKRIEEKKVTKRQFWVARIARIYPLHLLTLVGVALVGNYITPMSWIEGVKHFIPAFFLLHPFIPEMDYFFYFDSPSWSLGCEQLFYFLFPFLALVFYKRQRLAGALLVCAVVMVICMSLTDETHIRAYWYVNPLARFPDFLVGMLLYHIYEWCSKKKLSFGKASFLEMGAVCVFLLFYLFSEDVVSKVFRYSCYYWIPISFVLLIFSLQKGFISHILSNKYLVIGGDISYSFYLIHLWVIFAYVGLSQVYGWHLSPYISIPAIFVTTIGMSLLSYYYFEKPANRFVKRILKKNNNYLWRNNYQRKRPV